MSSVLWLKPSGIVHTGWVRRWVRFWNKPPSSADIERQDIVAMRDFEIIEPLTELVPIIDGDAIGLA